MSKQNEIPAQWQDFMKEARIAIESGEPLADFYERMTDDGFTIHYYRRDLNHERAVFLEVIRFFNKRCGTNYKEKMPSAISNLIINRYREGHSVDTMKGVINMKACAWLGAPMEANLVPHIIFDRTKFESYAGKLRPVSRPAPTPSPGQGLKAPLPKEPPVPPRKKSLQELIDGDVNGMRFMLEELYKWDSKTQHILLALIPLNIVWDYLRRIKKIHVDQSLFEKARQFSEQKAQEYKQKDAALDMTETLETCRRYYIIKSLFKGQHLNDVKAWVMPEQFINIPR